jgi:hypothetical protein
MKEREKTMELLQALFFGELLIFGLLCMARSLSGSEEINPFKFLAVQYRWVKKLIR